MFLCSHTDMFLHKQSHSTVSCSLPHCNNYMPGGRESSLYNNCFNTYCKGSHWDKNKPSLSLSSCDDYHTTKNYKSKLTWNTLETTLIIPWNTQEIKGDLDEGSRVSGYYHGDTFSHFLKHFSKIHNMFWISFTVCICLRAFTLNIFVKKHWK